MRVLEGHKWIKPFAVVFAHSRRFLVLVGRADFGGDIRGTNLEDLGIDPEWKHPGPGSICPFP